MKMIFFFSNVKSKSLRWAYRIYIRIKINCRSNDSRVSFLVFDSSISNVVTIWTSLLIVVNIFLRNFPVFHASHDFRAATVTIPVRPSLIWSMNPVGGRHPFILPCTLSRRIVCLENWKPNDTFYFSVRKLLFRRRILRRVKDAKKCTCNRKYQKRNVIYRCTYIRSKM